MVFTVNVNDGNFYKEVLLNGGPVLAVFSAPWCGYCKQLAPVLEKLAEEYKGKVKICIVDSDNTPKAAAAYGVTGMPTLFFFKNDNDYTKLPGYQPENIIKQHLDAML